MSRAHWLGGVAAAVALTVAVPAARAAQAPAALIIAQGGLGDKSYNDLADTGFKQACAANKLTCKDVELKDVVAQAENILRTAAGPGGFGVIVDLEYSHGDALKKVAADYPKVDFAILNEVQPGANVASLLFKEQEGSYLAGALAAQVASDPTIKGVGPKPIIGVIGGIKSAGIDKFIAGYIQGAHDINPKCEVKVAYSNNFGDPAIGLQMAKAMFDQGREHRLSGGRRHRHRRDPGGQAERPFRDRRRYRSGRAGAGQRADQHDQAHRHRGGDGGGRLCEGHISRRQDGDVRAEGERRRPVADDLHEAAHPRRLPRQGRRPEEARFSRARSRCGT